MPVEAGTLLGPYQIHSALGAGGMGDVYRARDTRLDRIVAIKIVRGQFSDRFEREARAISALNHPNICGLHDIGTADGQQYLVMEYVEGKPLSGPLPIAQALQYAAQILDALDAAHQKGITHRDLKPANILITKGGVKLLDFGLAKIQTKASAGSPEETVTIALTGAHTIIGTPQYMAPEQIEGREADARTDIFAFGCVLYEMITGKKAFEGKTPSSVMAAVLSTEPAPMSTLAPVTPPALERIVRTCLAKDPEDRWQSARDLRKLLDGALEERPAAVSPRTRQRLLWPGIAAVVALGAGYVLSTLLAPQAINTENLRFTPIATEAEGEVDPSWSPDGKSLAYIQTVGTIPQVFVRNLDSPSAEQLTKMPGRCRYPFWARDGSRVYFSAGLSGFRELWSVALAGGAPELVLRLEDRTLPIDGFTLSPDGKSLLVARRERPTAPYSLWITPVAGPSVGNMRKYQPFPFEPMEAPGRIRLRFSPDRKKLLYMGSFLDGDLQLWLLPWPDGQGVARRVLPSVRLRAFEAGWFSDNRHLIIDAGLGAWGAGQMWIADIEGNTVHPLTDGRSTASVPAVAPDGKRVAFVDGTNTFDIGSLPLDGSPPSALLNTSRMERYPAWSPVADQFAFVTDRSGVEEIWLRSRREASSRPLVRPRDFPAELAPQAFYTPVFSPDGQRILFGTPSGLWISSLGGSPPVRITAPDISVRGVGSWSPDGQWIVFLRSRDGEIYVEKSRVGGQQPPVGIVKVATNSTPLWSPAGDWIAIANPGLAVLSPDGMKQKILHAAYDPTTSAYGWSRDGKLLYVVYPENGRTILGAISVETGAERRIADYGTAVQLGAFLVGSNTLSLAPDGKSLATSTRLAQSDIWIMEGLELPGTLFSRLWPWKR